MTRQLALSGLSLTSIDANQVAWVTSTIAGWGSPASNLQLTPKARALGAWATTAVFLAARTITLGGYVEAPSEDLAVAAVDQLASAATLTPTTLAVTEGSVTRNVIVQRQDLVDITWVNEAAFQWTLTLAAADPRKFGTVLSASTGLPSSTGGFTFPLRFPFSINSTVVSGNCSLTNPGNTTGPVTLRIDGPITGPVVTHVSSGLALVFASSLSLGSGEWLTVDMENQQVLANGQSSRNGWVTNRGWSGFDPGPNTWALAATSGSGSLTVTATPAWQ